MFQWDSTIKVSRTKTVIIIISSWSYLLLPWWSWKIALLTLNSNHSLLYYYLYAQTAMSHFLHFNIPLRKPNGTKLGWYPTGSHILDHLVQNVKWGNVLARRKWRGTTSCPQSQCPSAPVSLFTISMCICAIFFSGTLKPSNYCQLYGNLIVPRHFVEGDYRNGCRPSIRPSVCLVSRW